MNSAEAPGPHYLGPHYAGPHFTEPTLPYWQQLVRPEDLLQQRPPWRFGFPASLPDGRVLVLPIRRIASDPTHAFASLICNQASFTVADALSRYLAERLAPLRPEAVIGLPTLGLTFASLVAGHLGFDRYVPLGYSRKFWYDDALSIPVHSVTSPRPGKQVYLDPNLLQMIQGRRVVLVDDAVSSGTTLNAAWTLIERLGAQVLAGGVVMRQSRRWVDLLGPARSSQLIGVFDSPLLKAVDDGWIVDE